MPNSMHDSAHLFTKPETCFPDGPDPVRGSAVVQSVPFSETTGVSIKAWMAASEIAAARLPGLPFTARSVRRMAKRLCWHRRRDAMGRALARRRRGRGGGMAYHVSLLPVRAQAVLITRAAPKPPTLGPEEMSGEMSGRILGQAGPEEDGKTPDTVFDSSGRSVSGMPASPLSCIYGSSYRQMWAAFERLPGKGREIAFDRLKVLTAVEALMSVGGLSKDRALCHMAQVKGLSRATLYAWFRRIYGVPTEHRLPMLTDRRSDRGPGKTAGVAAGPKNYPEQADIPASLSSGEVSYGSLGPGPEHHSGNRRCACPDAAFELLKADWLRPEQPSFMSCYRRLKAVAEEKGWLLPCARSLYRQMMEDVPAVTRVLKREGPTALKRLYPAQERDRTVFHAMEAVNADGHVWDVFVNWPGVKKPVRPVMVAIQDLYSGKILAWRLGRRENTNLVLLAFADLMTDYGTPRHAWFDNGRAFRSRRLVGLNQGGGQGRSHGTSKSGKTIKTQNQAQPKTCRQDTPHHHADWQQEGVLTALGIELHWTLPYSGQSKPIERAFRDFCDAIAKHPALAGAYTGNSPSNQPANYGSRAVPLDLFRSVVAEGIREHNARPGRRTGVCGGKLSFDEAFAACQTVAIRQTTAEQLALCLPSAVVRLDSLDGSLRLAAPCFLVGGPGHSGENRRYWTEELLEHRGRYATVRFDPDHPESVRVYSSDGSFLCEAALLRPVGFDDPRAAKAHARARQAFIEGTSGQHSDMSR